MDHLNRNQFILLVLLICFVTSIATGIMTVSLLQQAPVEVTRTINQVVEKTIEQVTPGVISPATPGKAVTTVVVKEEDSIIGAVNKNIPSIVRIREKVSSSDVGTFYTLGIVVNASGLVATERKAIVPDDIYTATLTDGTEVTLFPTGTDKKTEFMLFKAVQPLDKKIIFVPATMGSVNLQLGQTIISLGGESSNAVSVGRVVSLSTKESGIASTSSRFVSSIETDVSSKDVIDGTLLVNLSGDVVGVKTSTSGQKSFESISILNSELADLVNAIK